MTKSGDVIRPGTVCWSCKHFSFHSGDRGYSEYTPGYSASMYCAKAVWRFSFEDSSQEELEKTLKTAETCKEFEARNTQEGKEKV